MKTLDLAVGKHYRNKLGHVVTIKKENDNETGLALGYKFIAHGGKSYTQDGIYSIGDASDEDLFEEVSSPDDYLEYEQMQQRIKRMS